MKDKLKGILIALAAVAALGAGGAAIAGATGGSGAQAKDDKATEKPITGSALDRASAVALKKVGSGKVTQTEAGDEEGAYEVEVTKPDVSQVDVRLDKQFNVTQVENDHEDAADGQQGDSDGETADDHGSAEGPNGDGDGETADDTGASSRN